MCGKGTDLSFLLDPSDNLSEITLTLVPTSSKHEKVCNQSMVDLLPDWSSQMASTHSRVLTPTRIAPQPLVTIQNLVPTTSYQNSSLKFGEFNSTATSNSTYMLDGDTFQKPLTPVRPAQAPPIAHTSAYSNHSIKLGDFNSSANINSVDKPLTPVRSAPAPPMRPRK